MSTVRICPDRDAACREFSQKCAACPERVPAPTASAITDEQIEAHMTIAFGDKEVPQAWFKRADVLRVVRAVLALAPIAGGVPAERERCAQCADDFAAMMENGAGEYRPGQRLRQLARKIRDGEEPLGTAKWYAAPAYPQSDAAQPASSSAPALGGVYFPCHDDKDNVRLNAGAELMRAVDAYAYDYASGGKLAPSRVTVEQAVYAALAAPAGAAGQDAESVPVGELVSLRRRAARYDWLRDKSEPGICAFYLSVGKAFHGVKFTRETVDMAIDAALAAQGNGGTTP